MRNVGMSEPFRKSKLHFSLKHFRY